jgi:hypothetical protein
MRVFATVLLFACALPGAAQTADTTWVQTFTFEAQNNPATPYDSPGRRWFDFPDSDNGTSYRKVLMYHRLKCFEDGTAGGLGYPCGEWDYLTYTYLFDHTGVLDSNLLTHPRWKIEDLDFVSDTILFPAAVPHDTLRSVWSRPVLELAGASWTAGEGGEAWGAGEDWAGAARLQVLFGGEELAGMGLEPGGVQAVELPWAVGPGSAGAGVEVRLRGWAGGELVGLVDGGWEAQARWVVEEGVNSIVLEEPWVWDGVEGLVLEVAVEDAGVLQGAGMAGVAPGRTRLAFGAGNYVRFDGGDRFEVDAEAIDGLGDAVTVEFWQRGNALVQPENSTLFEAHGPQGQRELNVHLPWSNSRVYWDAGYSGGYDRIDAAATEAQYEGRWNHWAFVKDAAAGTMAMYLNGVLFHSGSNLDNPIGEVVRFHIGCDGWGGTDYRGDVDEFRVWNAALAPEVIAAYRSRPVDGAHPELAALRADFHFDGADGTASEEGVLHGNAGRVAHRGAEAFFREGPVAGELRPAFRLLQGAVAVGEESVVVDQPVPVPPVSITAWEVAGYGVVMTDLAYGWPAGAQTTTRLEDGTVVATYPITGPEVVYLQDTLSYFSVPFEVVERVELGRYITPYGIGLTLGDDGWAWVYDVTDYLPLLRDSVELEAGNWQELLDLKFAFIHGTPPRDVERVEAFWRGSYGLAGFDLAVEPHTFTPAPGEEGFRLLTRASGHGFGSGNNCAEFCNNIHSVRVDGTLVDSWQIMRECGDNPLYPQGGTWIYDRAGWCPGAPVDTREIELTPHVATDEPFTVEYDILYDPYGNYVMEGQIVAYGPPNFTHDVELMDILAPTDDKLQSRWNPVCEGARIRIRNTGSEPLTSCTFTCAVTGGAPQTFAWEGSLAFLETAVVDLPYTDPVLTEGGDELPLTFSVEVTSPLDGQTSNNASSTTFHRVPTWSYPDLDDNRVIVWTKTNNVPWETSVRLTDVAGEVVWSRTYAEANTTFRDTLSLNAGCYRIEVLDTDDDGQDFWANDDGSGYTRIKRVAGGNFVNFEPDFGRSISQAFHFATNLVSVASPAAPAAVPAALVARPNPTSGTVHILPTGFRSDAALEWTLLDASGRPVRTGRWSHPGSDGVLLDLTDVPAGLYAVQVRQGTTQATTRILKN